MQNAPETKSATRDLLKAYYGEAVLDSSVQVPAAINKKSPDSFNPDSKAFEPEKFLTKILYEQSVSDLISSHSELITSMKEIDGSMKTLVYENYNKFNSAIDTIKSLQSNVESMESEVQLLQCNVENINKTANQINQSLAEKRTQIQKLVSVRGPLNTLQSIIDLPNKLNLCVNQKAFATAHKLYQRASGLLAANRHLRLFNNIEQECQAIINSIEPNLAEERVASSPPVRSRTASQNDLC